MTVCWRSLWFLVLLQLVILSSCQENPGNGGSVLAMAGDGCLAVAVDKRFGSGYQMVNVSPRHVLKPNSRLLVAFTGAEGDVQSLRQELAVQIRQRRRRQQKDISPKAMASLTSHTLYAQRRAPLYVEPIVAGLGRDRPFLCSYDVIGAQSRSDRFVCAGVASKSLYGTAEAAWRPGLKSEELARVCGKAFLSALERDTMSGYGATVYLMSEDNITEIDLVCRDD